ncbi:MAG: hypothetical protein [Caudoviricetes sp.]|nr:MAG: hypothetical protein [Caudoviricetes sp.]
MATLKEKRAVLMDQLKTYQGKLKEGTVLSEEDAKNIKGLLGQVEDLDKQIAKAKEGREMLDSISHLSKADPEPTGTDKGDAVRAKTPGDCFVRMLQAKGLNVRDAFKSGFEVSYKASTDTQLSGGPDGAYGPFTTQLDQEGVHPYHRPLVVADLFAQGSLTGSSLKYPVYGELDGGAKTVKEAGTKAQAHFPDPTWQVDTLGEIAVWFGVSDDMVEDLPWLQGEITDAAEYSLGLEEENQLLNGDGTDPNLKGLLNRGVQTLGQGSDSDADRLFSCRRLISSATGFSPDGIVINPVDYEAIRLSKDSNGQYFGGGYFAGQYGNGGIMQDPPIWGLRTVVTEAVNPGTAIVGAFKAGGKVLRKGGLDIKSTDSHADYFINDKQAIRLKERVGLQIKYPKAFVQVTLGQAKASK